MFILLCIVGYLIVGGFVSGLACKYSRPPVVTEERLAYAAVWPFVLIWLISVWQQEDCAKQDAIRKDKEELEKTKRDAELAKWRGVKEGYETAVQELKH